METSFNNGPAVLDYDVSLNDARIIDLPKIHDPRGNLSFIEEFKPVPFTIERTYWIYDVPGGEKRGSHAYKENCEFIIALSGSFDVCLHDGIAEQKFSLRRSYYGLYVPRMLWRTMENFSTNSLALVLSSSKYDEEDYIRDFELFSIQKRLWMGQKQMYTDVQSLNFRK